jgi:hypothetical protein
MVCNAIPCSQKQVSSKLSEIRSLSLGIAMRSNKTVSRVRLISADNPESPLLRRVGGLMILRPTLLVGWAPQV